MTELKRNLLQKPNWELGKGLHGYHAITIGWLVDCLLRRVDPKGRSLGQFVREEVTEPNGLISSRARCQKIE